MMRLLIDLQGLQSPSSRDRGIGRYLNSLSRAILKNAGQHEVHFLLNGSFRDDLEDIVRNFSDLAEVSQFHIFDIPSPTSAFEAENSWRRAAAEVIYKKIVEDLNPDFLLIGSLFEGGNDNSISVVVSDQGHYRVAVILYDLIPLLDPDTHIRAKRQKFWYFNKVDQIRMADLLFGISHSACADGIRYLPSDESKVHYIGAASSGGFNHETVGFLESQSRSKELLKNYGIVRPFVMHASAFEPRKNFEGLIRAYGLLPLEIRRSHQLVLVCKLNDDARQALSKVIADENLGDEDVVLTGFVPDDHLCVLYGQCKIFAFPSFYEGFGLPALEAMKCGAPAIGSNLSSVPEVIGRDDALFDPNDIQEMSHVLARALSDEIWRQELIAHAREHVLHFCWDNVARRALSAMEQQLENARQAPSVCRETMEFALQNLAELRLWPGASDSDLLATAGALAANERLSWPLRHQEVSGIPNANLV